MIVKFISNFLCFRLFDPIIRSEIFWPCTDFIYYGRIVLLFWNQQCRNSQNLDNLHCFNKMLISLHVLVQLSWNLDGMFTTHFASNSKIPIKIWQFICEQLQIFKYYNFFLKLSLNKWDLSVIQDFQKFSNSSKYIFLKILYISIIYYICKLVKYFDLTCAPIRHNKKLYLYWMNMVLMF